MAWMDSTDVRIHSSTLMKPLGCVVTPTCSSPMSFDRGPRGVIGRDYERAVDLDPRQRLDVRAGGDDQVLRLELLRPNLHRVPVAQAPVALDDLDLVLLHQELDALVELVHHGVPPGRDA